MNSIDILYPAFGMFFLTMGCIFVLGMARYRAIHKGEVKISYFRTYDEGSQPKRLHLMARHVQNHFEVPPLFYVGVILAYLTESVSLFSLFCAWFFVVARAVHSFIHLGKNNVSHRFFTFGISLISLTGLWLAMFFELLGSNFV